MTVVILNVIYFTQFHETVPNREINLEHQGNLKRKASREKKKVIL